MNRAFDPLIPDHETCRMTRFPIVTPTRNMAVETYEAIVANLNHDDPLVRGMVTLEQIEAVQLYEHLRDTYIREQDQFVLHIL